MMPLLLNHDIGAERVGYVVQTGTTMLVTMRENYALTREQLYEMFGNCGCRILRMEGERIVEFEILEFSLAPKPVSAGQ